MSFDPDFHQAADAWLDAGHEPGQGRILLDILHESPAAVREFAALARVRAVLENAPLSEQERLQRAARLLKFSLRRKLRILATKPAVRWGAAAALAVSGVTWAMVGSASRTGPTLANHSNPPKKPALPRSSPSAVRSPESLPPADPVYVKLMDSLLIPDFEAVDLSLQEAVSLLTRKAAALDSSPLTVAIVEPPEGLSEKRVHLKLKFQPASTLLKLIALQTVMRIRETGQSHQLREDTEFDPADVDYRLVNLERWDSFLESQGLITSAPAGHKNPTGGITGHESGRGVEPPPPAAAKAGNAAPDLETFRLTLLGTLNQMPKSVEVWDGAGSSESSPSLNVGSGQKLDAMLELLLAGPDAPGTLSYDLRWVTFKNHAAVERMFNNNRKPEETAGSGGPALWSEESLPRLLKFLAEDPDVKMKAAAPLRIAPGRVGVCLSPNSMPFNFADDSNWTGQVCTITSSPAGGKITISLRMKSRLPVANGGISSHELSNKLTLAVGSSFTVGGMINAEGEHMLIVTARLPGSVPYGIAITDRLGFVRSPYALDKGLIDVEGIPKGTRKKCPWTGQVFRVPE